MYKILAKTLILGKKVVYLPSCHSTNDIARDLTKNGHFIEGMVVITDDQTAGRGQMGNSWESKAHQNLTFSLVFRPTFIPVQSQFKLTMVIALGLVEYLDSLQTGFQIKWPNDIYFEDKKIAGILIQNTIGGGLLENAVAGIGLNVNQMDFHYSSATSLRLILDREFQLTEVLESLCLAVEKRYLQLKKGKTDVIKSDYLNRLLGYQASRVFHDGEAFNGKIIDVEDNGRLVLESLDGIRYYDFKEVRFIF